MTDQPDNPLAFPMLGNTRENSELDLDCQQVGMSLRDYFAGQIIGSLVACSVTEAGNEDISKLAERDNVTGQEWIVTAAYRTADAMLEARKQ